MSASKQNHSPRGALSNPQNRYASTRREAFDDGWGEPDDTPPPPTELIPDRSQGILSRNNSPDVPFEVSINPYRGCEHGCVYCYARPTHAYLNHSPGLEFETKIHYKADAARLLRAAWAKPSYRCTPIMLGANTDAYQPAERQLGITRALLERFAEHRHPVMLITKSALIERDLDLLADLARDGLAHAAISVTTLDRDLCRRLEPRAAAPARRFETIARLSAAGIPVTAMIAPLIPILTDPEMETLLQRSRETGAQSARYVLLRTPLEVEGLFTEWLIHHRPLQANRVLERLKDCHGGAPYDSRFGQRMTGNGVYARLFAKRFRLAAERLGFQPPPELRTDRFQPPRGDERQLSLF